MQGHRAHLLLLTLLAVAVSGCTDTLTPAAPAAEVQAATLPLDAYAFPPTVFDIAALPDGGLLVAVNSAAEEIRPRARTRVAEVPTLPGAAINGLGVIGRGN